MKTSTHRRLYNKQGEAYRWELSEKNAQINTLKRNNRWFTDNLVPMIHSEHQMIPHDRLMLTIEISAEHLRSKMPQEILLMVRDRILERLDELNKDYRPDMRQQDKNERLLIR